MSNALIRWNTARRVFSLISPVRYLSNFSQVDAEAHQEFQVLLGYVKSNMDDADDQEPEDTQDLLPFLDKVYTLQRLIHDDPDPKIILSVSKQLFDTELDGARAVEMDIILRAEKLHEAWKPAADLLNEINLLCPYDLEHYKNWSDAHNHLSEELVTEIRSYLKTKQ